MRFRNILREFSFRYEHEDGSPVTPSTMINYIQSLNRAVKFYDYDVDIFSNPIFTDKKEGLIRVLENHFTQQQADGSVVCTTALYHVKTLSKYWTIQFAIQNIRSDMFIDI